MNRGQVLFIVGALFAIGAALILAIALQPQQPNFAGDRGYQEQSTSYRAGGSGCEPSKISALSVSLRQRKADACAEGEEQHREAANNFIENRRAAIAAEASAVANGAQARIEAWGAGIGLLTLFAALAAAIFAERAAFHTKAGANAAQDSLDLDRLRASAELRPWINISARAIRFIASGTTFELHYEVAFENIGKTAAQHFRIDYITQFTVHGGPEVAARYADWNEQDIMERKALMPGEIHKAPGTSAQSKAGIRWVGEFHGHDDGLNRCMWTIIASCRYWSEIDKRWHRTDRSFAFGQRCNDPFDEWYLLGNLSGEWEGDELDKRFVVTSVFAGETS